jgi:hypothetical protein
MNTAIETKIGLSMTLPEGKQPGFYSQIVKTLAARVKLFDRDKDMLVVSVEDEREAVLDVMRHFRVETEQLELLLLPASAATSPLFADYGFVTRLDNRYLYRDLVALFTLHPIAADAEPDLALQQLDEYVIAVLPAGEHADSGADASAVARGDTGNGAGVDVDVDAVINAGTVYAIDRQHDELAVRIAAAYRCRVDIVQL